MTLSLARFHSEWPRLLDTSGTFLTLPVLKRAFADGLEPAQRDQVARLREELALFRQDPDRQRVFVRYVLTDLLGYGPVLREGPAVPLDTAHPVPERGVTLRPDAAIVEPDGPAPRARLLITLWPLGTDPMRRVPDDGWSASPVDRMAILLRSTSSARLGLVTDGLRWVLVSTVTPVTTTAVFDADIWLEERETLDAFVTLLRAKRLFSVPEGDRLEDLFAESAGAQEEVTSKLGEQVRQAVELLVAAFSRADREVGGRLLAEVTDDDVYGAAVSVMMRLVFLLYAEERRLFPLDDDLYQTSYAASTLFDQLEEEARGEVEVLDRRSAAWGRLLALFRAIHDGIQHEDLLLAAHGGSLFDPNRYPFLEGRPTAATPLHQALPIQVTDLEVRDVMQALQVLRFSARGVTEARRLSYRNLDVEQIGHVYEGLLDHGAVRVDDVHLGLRGKLEPEIALADLEERRALGESDLRAWIAEVAGMTARQVDQALDSPADELTARRLRVACDGDDDLVARITPFLGLVRPGPRDLPTVFLAGSVYVTKSGERRSSGTYYTPRSLAEEMVEHALEPLVYSPGPQDTPDRAQWRLRPAAEILDLKVCDMTMGSGAFLVAACRFLADRLLETTAAGGDGHRRAREGEDTDELVDARRLIVERCLYGVDRNPMAVEMAKLSMWLVTLAKDRPFTFLDGSFACGDALLGITSLDQVARFHMDPSTGEAVHGGRLAFDDHLRELVGVVSQATALRDELAAIRVLDVRDAERKRELLQRYRDAVAPVQVIADLVVGAALSTATERDDALRTRLVAIIPEVDAALTEDVVVERAVRIDALRQRAVEWLNAGRPPGAPVRSALHWAIEFPEVFGAGRRGFDAVVGNPPFLGGQRITGALGTDYREHLVTGLAGGGRGSADLVAYMFLRAASIASGVALLATNTIAQGDTRQVGLEQLTADGWTIIRANKSRKWPGDANLEIAQVWLRREWTGERTLIEPDVMGRYLRAKVDGISSYLDVREDAGAPRRLAENAGRSFQGSIVLGLGFVLEPDEADALIAADPRNAEVIKPYLNGQDLNSRPDCSAARWVINFYDWDEARARSYGDCWRIIDERVRPERQRLKADGSFAVRGQRVLRYWQFAERAPKLYTAIGPLERVIVIARISSVVQPVLAPTGQVFNEKTVVFPTDDLGVFSLLCSSFHTWWAVRYSSTLETRVNYAPSDCFETFPQPQLNERTERVGRTLHETRSALMRQRSLGLTKTYNLVHDQTVLDGDVAVLRDAHVAVDVAIRACYGWDDLALDHGFHETPLGVRFAVSPAARRELLRRLLALNHERAAAEASQAAPGVGARAGRSRAPRPRPSRTVSSGNPRRRGIESTLPLDIEGTLPL